VSIQEALKYAEIRLERISYNLEMTNKLPCRSFYEKQQEMLIQAVSALRENQEREKGCGWCKGLTHGCLADGETLGALQRRAQIAAGYYCPYCGRKLEESK
jgi:hypothetical protein